MTDADCVFVPDALLLALGAQREHRADVVSLVPDLHCEGFWERLLIPIQYFVIFAFLADAPDPPDTLPLVRGSQWGISLPETRNLFCRGRTPGRAAAIGRGCQIRAACQAVEEVTLVRGWVADLCGADVSRSGRDMERVFQEPVPSLLQEPAPSALGHLCAGQRLCPAAGLDRLGMGPAARGWTWLPLTSYLGLAAVRLGLTARFGRDSVGHALLKPTGVGDGDRDRAVVGLAQPLAARQRVEGARLRGWLKVCARRV